MFFFVEKYFLLFKPLLCVRLFFFSIGTLRYPQFEIVELSLKLLNLLLQWLPTEGQLFSDRLKIFFGLLRYSIDLSTYSPELSSLLESRVVIVKNVRYCTCTFTVACPVQLVLVELQVLTIHVRTSTNTTHYSLASRAQLRKSIFLIDFDSNYGHIRAIQ